MSESEFQDEEREVLLSIYDGDDAFKQLSPTVFQYKYGENDNIKSLLLELIWGEKYPTEKPEINMDTFYNKHVKQSLKDKVKVLVSKEAEQYLGMSMTYTLFEFLKEKFDALMDEQSDQDCDLEGNVQDLSINEPSQNEMKKKIPKKEQLTKAQKRRQWNKVGEKGEKPRGWNWMDIVKHLSQTGSKEDQLAASSAT